MQSKTHWENVYKTKRSRMRSVGFKSMLFCPSNLSKGLNHAKNPKLLMLAAALQFWLTNYGTEQQFIYCFCKKA